MGTISFPRAKRSQLILGLVDTFFGNGTFLIPRSAVENIHTYKFIDK
jgi:hypothetical protein